MNNLLVSSREADIAYLESMNAIELFSDSSYIDFFYEDGDNSIGSTIVNKIRNLVEKKFCGWAIYHRFRCANRLGIKSLADILLVTDENFESLKIRLMLDDNDPQGFKQIKQTIDGIIER
mgnify:CR=1 FL=1